MILTIGNDIVDLQEEVAPLHPRFIDRVFTAKEQSRFGLDTSRMWLNWSAKEAAFKAISRIKPETIFSPIEFELLNDESISFREYQLHHKFILNEQFAFSYCSNCETVIEAGKVINWISTLSEPTTQQSTLIREFAKKELTQYYGEKDIEISPASRKNIAPKIILAGDPIDAELSFSHHGMYLACSFLDRTHQ